MRTVLSVLALGITGLLFAAPSAADEDFAAHGTVKATRAKDGKVTITVAGKGDWHVNMEYDIKVTLGAEVLRKKDASYEGAHDGKADKAVFHATDAASSGKVKAVFCDKTSCSNPMASEFTVKE